MECKDHKQTFIFYCKDCNTLFCAKCISTHIATTQHSQWGHIEEYAKVVILPGYQKELEELSKQAKDSEASNEEFMKALENLLLLLNTIIAAYKECIAKISEEASKIKLCNERGLYDDLVINREELEKRIASLSKALRDGNNVEILKHYNEQKKKEKGAESGVKSKVIELAKETQKVVDNLSLFPFLAPLKELNAQLEKYQMPLKDENIIYLFNEGYLMLYDIDRKLKKRTKLEFITAPKYSGTLKYKASVYIAGGGESGQELNTSGVCLIERDLSVNQRKLANMKNAKCATTLVMVKSDSFYSIGGHQSAQRAFCEKYDIQEDTWTSIPSLNEPKYFFAVAVQEEKYIYCLEGAHSTTSRAVERYDATLNTPWETIPFLIPEHLQFGQSGNYSSWIKTKPNEFLIFSGGQCCACDLTNKKIIPTKILVDSIVYDNQTSPILLNGKVYFPSFDGTQLYVIDKDKYLLEKTIHFK